MKRSLYLETTIPSYLTSRPSRDLVTAARQEITRDWWSRRKEDFRIFISQIVIDEASEGDPEAARKRLSIIRQFTLLDINDDITSLAETILKTRTLPRKAARDAAHIAVAAFHDIDFLLTWNCVHLANAEMFGDLNAICLNAGYHCPVICTPEELIGG